MRVISSQFFSGTKETTRARIMRVISRQKRVNQIRASFVKDERSQMRVDTHSLAGAVLLAVMVLTSQTTVWDQLDCEIPGRRKVKRELRHGLTLTSCLFSNSTVFPPCLLNSRIWGELWKTLFWWENLIWKHCMGGKYCSARKTWS